MHALAAAALTAMLVMCSPAGRPMLAEVLYDASGDDTDREFVELLNPGDAAASLAGLRIEAGDGAGPNRWTLRWTGTSRDSIAPHARFVIGGALVRPPPDAIATLDLQNGPDAVRLVWPDGATEVLGYGQPLAAEYFCGAPAADAPSGFSLARIPDDADHRSNTDFVPAVPSPGAANQVAVDVACVRGSLAITPDQPAAYAPARLACAIENRGTAPLAAGAAALTASEAGAALAQAAVPALAAGESVRVALDLPGLAPGRHALAVRATLAGDQRAANDADTLVMRAGSGPLVITEIQFHPAAGEGEWVEVRADSDHVSPGDFTLSDRGGSAASLPALAAPLAAGAYALLAQNRAALLAHFGRALDSSRVIQPVSWDALNNSDGEAGTADAVVLRGPGALPCDRVEYSARGVPSGEPIELGSLGWGLDSDPVGTPLAPPRELAPLASRFTLSPRRVTAGITPVLGWMLPWPRARLSVEVFDLAGRRVTSEAARLVGARGESRLAGLPGPGVYLVALHAVEESGAGVIQESRVLRMESGR